MLGVQEAEGYCLWVCLKAPQMTNVSEQISPVLADIDFSKCGIDALLRWRGEEYTVFFSETAEGRPLQSCLPQ